MRRHNLRLQAMRRFVQSVEPSGRQCSICHDPMNNEALRFSCGHEFDVECGLETLSRDVRCPLCRHDARQPHPNPFVPQDQEEEPMVQERMD